MEEAAKLVAVLVGIFGAYKVFADAVIAKSSTRRDEYGFIKQFLKDLNNNETDNFLLEKGFYALTGKVYAVPEIKYLLNFETPSIAINRRVSSWLFVEFNSANANYEWKAWCSSAAMQKKLDRGLLSWGYFIFAFTGFYGFFYEFPASLSSISNIVFYGSSLVVAVVCLINNEDFKIAVRFMKQVDESVS